jgi:hypothetical protein
MLLIDFSRILESGVILLDRLDYDIFILPQNKRAQELYSELEKILNREAVTDNITQLIEFLNQYEEEILELDALAIQTVYNEGDGDEKEKEEPT